jgi:hypothetical protein
MAGTGVKLFLSGEVALASDINTFLMDQAITRFANPTDRDSQFGDGIPVTQTNPSTGLPGSGKPELSVGRVCFVIQPDPSDPGIPGEVQVYTGTELGWQAASQFNVGDGSIGEAKLANGAVTSAKIAAAVAGNGLAGGGGTALSVNVDGSTLEINSDSLRVKDLGITSEKLATSLSLTTPTLGVASATSINKVAFTAPATSATLTLANGSTLATSGAHSVTLTSTGATTVTLPTTGTLVSSTGTSVVSESMITNAAVTSPKLAAPSLTSKTGAFTFALVDANCTIQCNSGSAFTATVPTSSVAFANGTVITLMNYGAGQVTIQGDTGVTIRSSNGLKLRTQYSMASLVKISNTEWVLSGDTVA